MLTTAWLVKMETTVPYPGCCANRLFRASGLERCASTRAGTRTGTRAGADYQVSAGTMGGGADVRAGGDVKAGRGVFFFSCRCWRKGLSVPCLVYGDSAVKKQPVAVPLQRFG